MNQIHSALRNKREQFAIEIRKSKREEIFKKQRVTLSSNTPKKCDQSLFKTLGYLCSQLSIEFEEEVQSIQDFVKFLSRCVNKINENETDKSRSDLVAQICNLIGELVDREYAALEYETIRSHLCNASTFQMIYEYLYLHSSNRSFIKMIEIEESVLQEKLLECLCKFSSKFDNVSMYFNQEQYINLIIHLLHQVADSHQLKTVRHLFKMEQIFIFASNCSIEDDDFAKLLIQHDFLKKITFRLTEIQLLSDEALLNSFFFLIYCLSQENRNQYIESSDIILLLKYFVDNNQSIFEKKNYNIATLIMTMAVLTENISEQNNRNLSLLNLIMEYEISPIIATVTMGTDHPQIRNNGFKYIYNLSRVDQSITLKFFIDQGILLPIQYFFNEEKLQPEVQNYIYTALSNFFNANVDVKQKIIDIGITGRIVSQFNRQIQTGSCNNELMYCIINAIFQCDMQQYQHFLDIGLIYCLTSYILDQNESFLDIEILDEVYETLIYIFEAFCVDPNAFHFKKECRINELLANKSNYFLRSMPRDQENSHFQNIERFLNALEY